MDKDVNVFLDKLDDVITQLNYLDKLSSDLYKKFEGEIFIGQDTLAAQLDNLLLVATHEVASELVFLKDDIHKIVLYIQFRIKYNFLSEFELCQLIDNKNRLALKQKLSGAYNDIYRSVQDDWSELFGNISFEKISNRYK